MKTKEKILELGEKTSTPSVTLSFNTHRTFPDNEQDRIVLKNLLSEAQKELSENYSEDEISELLKKIKHVSDNIDTDQNLDSMNIFLSKETQEIVKSTWPVQKNEYFVGDSFVLRGLLNAQSREQEYLVMLLSQSGVSLFEVINDKVVNEIENADFPFAESPYSDQNAEEASDSKKRDNLIREYLNQVDKALVEVRKKLDQPCVVVCTEDNFSKLMQVSDSPESYVGFAPIDYNKCKPHEAATQAWEIVQANQSERKNDYVEEVDSAVPSGNVKTDLQEIFQASIDGQGDLLLVNEEYAQSVKMITDRTFEYADSPTADGVDKDVINRISWEVLRNKGRVFFVAPDRIKKYGDIVLKTRY